MEIRVESYAGFQADEAPRCFWLEDRRIKVVEIINQWRTPDERFFKVSGDDGQVYILSTDGNTWCFR